jgi:tRNA pseudouridine55 synthase
MHGFLNVNKPPGLTSHDVVHRVRKWTGVKHVGHGGTLDPTATGVLPIGLGHGTRLLEFMPDIKVYRAAITFGTATDTYDASGEVTSRGEPGDLDRLQVEEALARYVGTHPQQPPAYSALRFQGTRLYTLARQGVAVETPPRPVRIDAITLTEWVPPVAWAEVQCGRGTYMRSLAHDVGRDLGCGAHLSDLVRLQDGGFHLAQSITLEDLQSAIQEGGAGPLLAPLDTPVQHWPGLRLTGSEERDVLQGRTVCANERRVTGGADGTEGPLLRSRAHSLKGDLIALLQRPPGDPCWHPFKVFPDN